MLRRSEQSKLTSWYFEIDRKLLWSILALVFVGVLAVVTAGSVAAERIGQPWHFFLMKSLPFYAVGLVTLFAASFFPKKWVLGIAWTNVFICLILLLVTLVAPMHIKGSARWVSLPGIGSVMPSDLLKPGFIIITAWFLARMHDKISGNIFTSKAAWKWDGWPSYLIIFFSALLIIFKHPDFGTSMLYFSVFGAMIFLAGLPLWFLPILGGVLGVFGLFAFFTMAHFKARLLGFIGLGGVKHDDYQIRQSLQSIQHGGLFGSGDDAFVKQSLPDAHTDFVFAALAEDWGAIVAVVLLCAMLYIIKRLSANALSARDKMVFYVCGGAAALFGIQVSINILSALHLFAPKGMTLPFISYGGSSFVSFSLLFGLIIALVREDKWK